MMNVILAIPDEMGWALVGASAMLLAVMVVKCIKGAITMYREYREDMEDIEDINE